MLFSGLSAVLALGYAIGVSGQSTTAYTDPSTGITFQRYETEGYSFGIALPENPTTDLIGQVVTPLTDGSGWGGVSFGGRMVATLLLVTWPNGSGALGSLREAYGWASPELYTSGTATLTPICAGTYANSTHSSYTFLCRGCIVGDGFTFAASDPSYVFGYAVSTQNPIDPVDPATPIDYHDRGFGQFNVDLEAAKSPNYASWAALAGSCSPTSSTSVPPSTSASPTPTSSSSSSTTITPTLPPLSSTRTTTTPTITPTATTSPRWGQCGGIGWTGPTRCVSPWTCRCQNPWFCQCL